MRCYILVISFLLSLTGILQAQFCTGTLGDNIFLEGDFGSGTSNLFSPNPNIAPGYNYTFNVPPLDGSYVLTNNTGEWPGLFSAWMGIGDNSSNPNGYMMMVNASNAPGLFYQQTISGLCGNTLFEFSADIINIIKTGTANHNLPNVSFLLNDVEYFSTGDIPQNETWTTYGFIFTTEPGQETLTLSLRNNAPGGIGNDLALDNISFRACGPDIAVMPNSQELTFCEDDSPTELQAIIFGTQYVNPAFKWQQSFDEGMTWSDITGATQSTFVPTILSPGVYYYRTVAADGVNNLAAENCRVNSDFKIVNVIPKETMQTEIICEGLNLEVGNSNYTETGIYVDTLLNFLGCDSILTTDLTVQPDNFMADLVITNSCPTVPNGSVSVVNLTGGTPPYNFNFDGIFFGTFSEYSDLAGGVNYPIIIIDEIGCRLELSAFVDNSADVFLELGENLEVELGESVSINPQFNFTPIDFNWTTLFPLVCIDFEDCDRLNFIPTMSQQVQLNLLIGEDCAISDSIFIEVIDKNISVYFPNIFSPNDDGINDVFTVFGNASNIQIVEDLSIFNRWGELVFEQRNFEPNLLQNGWNGTFKGRDLNADIYVYTSSVRFINEEVVMYSGDVYLIK